MSTTSFVGKAALIAPLTWAYQMIHLMNKQHSTGNPPYSIPSYSCGAPAGERSIRLGSGVALDVVAQRDLLLLAQGSRGFAGASDRVYY
jgi:hypothetical protein